MPCSPGFRTPCCGFDLLEAEDGPLVLEVNSSPGLEGIEKASGVNVAGAIIDYVMTETEFSEVDLDQLLRTVPGSGVLSLQIRNHPNVVGKRLASLFKAGAEIPVFALSRDNTLIWNPSDEIQLWWDDILVCYGELTKLRASLRQAILDVPSDAFAVEDREGSNA